MKEAVCAACGRKTSFFSSRMLPDGTHVCKECMKVIPGPFLEGKYASAKEARDGAGYGKWAMAKLSPTFSATVQYGRMFLDEKSGLFTVCDATSIGRDGKLKAPSPEVYPCIAVTKAGFSVSPVSPTSPVSHKSGIVTCRVTFSGYLEYCGIHIHAAIKKSAHCVLIPDDQGGAAWQEPEELVIFRSCYIQMVETAWRKAQQAEQARQMEDRMEQERAQKAREEAERQRQQAGARAAMEGSRLRDARILFMLSEGYTLADLKRQRAALMRAFHPDNGKVEDPVYAQRINEAYECLLGDLERRESR